VLRERTIDVWKRKLDWVAEHGGMVLLNTHPDYMCFHAAAQARDEYPVRMYSELLGYLLQQYANSFWHALPRDVARFYRENYYSRPPGFGHKDGLFVDGGRPIDRPAS
jgi:hypothetical protein